MSNKIFFKKPVVGKQNKKNPQNSERMLILGKMKKNHKE